jgi:autotransporter translocation and assembly factor TamB
MVKRILYSVVGVLLILTAAILLLLRTRVGQERLAKIAREQLARRLAGPVEIGGLSGELPGQVLLHDVVIRDVEGEEAVRIAELEVRLKLRTLMSRHVVVPQVRASGVVVHARRLSDGRLNLAALARPPQSTSTFELQNVAVDGGAFWQGLHAELHATGALTVAPEATTLKAVSGEVATRDLHPLLPGPTRAQVRADGSLRRLKLQAEATAPGIVARVDGELGAELRFDADVQAQARTLQNLHIDSLRAQARFVGVNGEVHLQARGVRAPFLALDLLEARLEAREHQLSLTVDGKGRETTIALAAHGELMRQIAAEVTLDRLALTFRGTDVRATGPAHIVIGPRFSVDDLNLVAQRRPDLSASMSVRADGTLADPRVQVKLDGRKQDQQLRLTARWQAARVSGQAQLTAPSQDLQVKANVPTSLAGAQPVALELTGRSHSLKYLRPYLPKALATLDGSGRIDLFVSGTTRQPQVALHVDGRQLALESLRQSRLHAKITYQRQRLHADLDADLAARHPAGSVAVSLALPLDLPAALRQPLARLEHTSPIELTAKLDGLAVAALPWRSPLGAGVVTGTVTVSGTLHDPRLRAELSGNHLAVHGVRGADAVLRASYADGDARVSLQADVGHAPVLFARASTHLPFRRVIDGLPWRSAPVDAEVVVPAWEADGGTVTAFAELHGSFQRPWGRVSARAQKIHYRETWLQKARLEGDFDGETLSASLWAEQPLGGKLRADTVLPLAADAPWNALISAQNVRLALSEVGPLHHLDGRLDGELSLSGTRQQPLMSGGLHLRDGVLAVAGEHYQEITADVTAHEDELELQKLELAANGGKLRATGVAKLANLSVKAVDIDADLHHLPVAQGPVGAWIDAELSLHGERAGASAFRGTVTVKKGTAHLPKLAGGRKLQPTGPLKEVVFTDAKAQRERARRKAAERNEVPLSALLAARIPGPFHIRSPELTTDLDGELQLEVIGPLVRVTGSIESNGGWIELLGRRYELERAHLGFGGQPEIDPELDVRITREVRDAVIAVEVQGTARNPKLLFSSDPPIYDETQIIGLVVSGDPGQSRTSDRSLDQQVVGALSGIIIGKLKDQIAPGLPIDVLKVETGEQGYTGLASTRVELGKYITESIYVSYVHQFGELQIGARRLNANEANVQWRFRRHFEVNTRFGDAGVGALDFFWTFRY